MNPFKVLWKATTTNFKGRPVVVLDLDDTLINVIEAMYQVMRRHNSDVTHWSEWTRFNMEEEFDITFEELIKMCNDDKTFLKAKPHTFSKAFLIDLRARGYHVVILTSRNGFVENAQSVTEKYLKEHELYYDELIVADIGVNKMNYLRHHPSIHFMIDDQVKNCEHFKASGKVQHVFLHAVPHNRYNTEFVRLSNLFLAYPHVGLED